MGNKIPILGGAADGGATDVVQLFKSAGLRQPIINSTSSTAASSVTFSSYTKDDILRFLKSPTTSEKTLRKASRQLYQNDIHYRKLLLHYAYMPLFLYAMSPVGYSVSGKSGFKKAYSNACAYLGNFDFRQECMKASLNAYVDGVYYGAIWVGKGKSFVQRIEPDYCRPSALEDGRVIYAVDMSRIKPDDLYKYPPEFTKMYNAYQNDGVRWQEVPSAICFCVLGDDATGYPFPPFASMLPSVFDLENMKDLATVSTELDNYKLVNYIYPTGEDGKPLQAKEINEAIYKHIANALPPQVGLAMTGKELKSLTFDRTNNGSRTDEIESAINSFWVNAGLPVALWGSTKVTSSSAISLALKSDEQICGAMLGQLERLFNALLRLLPDNKKFRIDMLPVTCYNYDKTIDNVKSAATLGLPVKQDYAALVNVSPIYIEGRCFMENEMLDLKNKFIPLSSTYTESAGDKSPGAPAKDDGDLSDEGERARDKPSANDQ